MVRFWISGILIAGFLSYILQFRDSPKSGTTRQPATFSFFKSSALENKDIIESASAPDLKVSKARVMIDNDAAFDSKLQAVRSARAGETIRLSYYIYSQDESSAVFLTELLKAAARGVHIRLIADFITNYGNLDLFSYLEAQGRGMIQIKLYGRPTPLIVRDGMFVTTLCPVADEKIKPTTCSDAKWKALEKTYPDFYARLLLAGLYDLDFTAVTTAVLKGQILDVETLTKNGSTSPEDKKQFLEFLKLVYKAKMKSDPIAGLKVMLALQLYGDKLNPILNEILGRVPVSQKGDKSPRDWEHITDFTHHKVLIIENRFVQLGGRNIENSYHMKPNSLTKKYIFMDTDMAAELSGGGDAISKAYDRLWNFSTMTMPLKDVRSLMPNDLVVNNEAMKASFDKCSSKNYNTPEDRIRFEKCVDFEVVRHPKYETLPARMAKIGKVLENGVNIYNTQYLPKKSYSQSWKPGPAYSDELSSKDMSGLLLAYIENLPFDRRQKEADSERRFGSIPGQELKYGKYIHQLWYKGLENTCLASAKDGKEKRVIIHSAYFLPPALLLRGFSKMLDGTWDCHKVRVTFLTNSPETTDLNHINVAARYVMSQFFQTVQNRHEIYGSYSDNRAARFEYFEYLKESGGFGLSLHTKTSVLGDDMIIGSANADVRSYYMDTNNGFFIRGAKELTAAYITFIDGITSDKKKTRDLTALYSNPTMTLESIFNSDRKMLEELVDKNELTKKFTPEIKEKTFKGFHSIVTFISEATAKILIRDRNPITGISENDQDSQRRQEQEQNEQEQKYDRLLQLL
jgi:cardiolipin synthase C